MEDISFAFVNPNEDVPFVNERHVRILDTVQRLHRTWRWSKETGSMG